MAKYTSYRIFKDQSGKTMIQFTVKNAKGEYVEVEPEVLYYEDGTLNEDAYNKAIRVASIELYEKKLQEAVKKQEIVTSKEELPADVEVKDVNEKWIEKHINKIGWAAVGLGVAAIIYTLGKGGKTNNIADKPLPKTPDKSVETVGSTVVEETKDLSDEVDGIITYEEAIKDIQKIKNDYQKEGYFTADKSEVYDAEVERRIASLYTLIRVESLPEETVNRLIKNKWINANEKGILNDGRSIIGEVLTQESQYASGYDDLEYSSKHIDLSPFFTDPNALNMYKSTQDVLEEIKAMDTINGTKEDKAKYKARYKEIYEQIHLYSIGADSMFGNMNTTIGGSYVVNHELVNILAIGVEKGLITTKDYIAIVGTKDELYTEITKTNRIEAALSRCSAVISDSEVELESKTKSR